MTEVAHSSPTNLNRLVIEIVEVLQLSIAQPDFFEIALELDCKLPEIDSNCNLLRQLVRCLLENSVSMMPEGGGLRISTKFQCGGTSSPYFELSIEDSGKRLPDDVIWNLYQPFASQTLDGQLANWAAFVRHLVRQLCGLMNCRTGAQGTRYLLLLPADQNVDVPYC